jgi:GNAT superfamily N-acetyltransferase
LPESPRSWGRHYPPRQQPKFKRAFTIRKIELRDERRWRELFDGYTLFYVREPSEAIRRHTWTNLINAASSVHAIVAVSDSGDVIGIANYVIHENTSALVPACYLQDLFVDPVTRASGVGKLMIDWLVAEMGTQSWSRLYWHTKETYYRARGLYDKYTPHSGLLGYAIMNSTS